MPVTATGGTVTEANGYRIHTFTSSGNLTVAGSGSVEYLVVAGGGGGGGYLAAGGGAGGFRTGTAALAAGTHSVIVGNGGSGGPNVGFSVTSTGSNGGDSSLVTPGLGSISFNNNYATLPANSAFTLGTGDFTIEFWYNASSFAAGNNYPFDLGSNGTRIQFYNNQIYTIANNTQINIGSAGAGMTTGTWNHVAWVRSSGTSTLYINGVSAASATFTGNLTDTGCTIGNYGGGGYGWVGNISNFRIVKAAVYTSSFTPSTSPLTAISGTSVLTARSPSGITDASSNAFTITATGATASASYPVALAGALVVSTGGGGGGGAYGYQGKSGGSGGGGGNAYSAPATPGAGNTPATSPSQGNDGGSAVGSSTNYGTGGGGGATSVGGAAYGTSFAGAGGSGASSSISGTSTIYAAGGGGAAYYTSGGAGGSGIGGQGGSGAGYGSPRAATSAPANSGSGGGGGMTGQGTGVGGSGGTGIVIIRYLLSTVQAASRIKILSAAINRASLR